MMGLSSGQISDNRSQDEKHNEPRRIIKDNQLNNKSRQYNTMSSEDLDERPSQRKLVFDANMKDDTVIRDKADETTPRMLDEVRPPQATGNYFAKGKKPPKVAQSIEKR